MEKGNAMLPEKQEGWWEKIVLGRINTEGSKLDGARISIKY